MEGEITELYKASAKLKLKETDNDVININPEQQDRQRAGNCCCNLDKLYGSSDLN